MQILPPVIRRIFLKPTQEDLKPKYVHGQPVAGSKHYLVEEQEQRDRGWLREPPMSAFVDLEYGDMAELTDKEKAALLKHWAAETEIELLEREYSKPRSVKLSVRAGKRGFRAGMEWAESNRSFKQVECMAKNYGLILQPEDEALFDDDDNAELSDSTWDKERDVTYGWGWQAGVEAVYNKWIGK